MSAPPRIDPQALAAFWSLPIARDSDFHVVLGMPQSSWQMLRKKYGLRGVVLAKRLYFIPAEVAEILLKNAKRRGGI